jgi:hypothetical protein
MGIRSAPALNLVMWSGKCDQILYSALQGVMSGMVGVKSSSIQSIQDNN